MAVKVVMVGQGMAGAVDSGLDQKGKLHYENCDYHFRKRSQICVDQRFGRAQSFLIYDLEKESFTVIDRQ